MIRNGRPPKRSWESNQAHRVAGSTVRGYVRERQEEIGLPKREMFEPPSYAWGEETEVDWYKAGGGAGDRTVRGVPLAR
jgi:hypothetical protein